MTLKEHLRATVNLALPVAVGQLGHIMLGVVDSMMVGRVGAEPLAAAALVNILFFLILILGIGMSIAVTPLVAIAQGEGKNEDCGIYLRQSLIVNMTLSLLLTIICFFGADFIHYLDQPPEVVVLAKSYFKILSFSILPFMLFQTYRQFIEGLSFTKPPMYAAILANIVNFIVNWLLIYGNLGFPALGLDGAGYASFFSRLAMGLGLMLYVLRSPKFEAYEPDLKFRSINFPVMKRIFNIGWPSALQYFFEMASFSISTIMVGWIGSVALAAHQIALNLASVTYMVLLGISSASTIRVANFFGKKDIRMVRESGFVSLGLGATLMAIFGLCFIIFNEFLPKLYISEKDVIQIASSLLIIAAFFQIFDGSQVIGMGMLRGITDVKTPLYFTFISYWIIGLPVSYFAAFTLNLGIYGIWIGYLAGLILAAFFFSVRFHIKTKKIGQNLPLF